MKIRQLLMKSKDETVVRPYVTFMRDHIRVLRKKREEERRAHKGY